MVFHLKNLKPGYYVARETASFSKMADSNMFFKYWQSILEEKSVISDNKLGCRLWKGPPSLMQMYGKQRIKWPDGSTSFEGAHRLSFMVHFQLTPEKMAKFSENGEKVEISHLCHNTMCIKIEHLVMERHSTNQERNHCKHMGRCMKSHSGPNCLF